MAKIEPQEVTVEQVEKALAFGLGLDTLVALTQPFEIVEEPSWKRHYEDDTASDPFEFIYRR